MHGLICRSFERFVRTAYGSETWLRVRQDDEARPESFEPMFHYDDRLADGLVSACALALSKPREALLEDFGTYLVAGAETQQVRRLLRYGGVDYEDFLHSLEDLPGRVALAVPDIGLPDLELEEDADGTFKLICMSDFAGAGHVMMGLLRAMADDYGALAFLDHFPGSKGRELILIQLLESAYSEGRGFDLTEGFRAVGGADA